MACLRFQFSLPRVRSDPTTKMPHLLPDNFNSRSLRGERWLLFQEVLLSAQFQFLLPVWGAIDSRCQLVQQGSISILAPCLGSDISEFLLQVLQLISILAPCEESDFVAISEGRLVVISILAPRVGSDKKYGKSMLELMIFNSRSLCGERYL